MLSIVLIGDKNFSLKDIEKVNHLGARRTYYSHDGLQYIIEFEDPIFINATGYPEGIKICEGFDLLVYEFRTYDDESVQIDFPKQRISHIPFEPNVFILVSYRNKETVKRILRQPDFPQNIHVRGDDDLGSIFSLQEFNKLD